MPIDLKVDPQAVYMLYPLFLRWNEMPYLPVCFDPDGTAVVAVVSTKQDDDVILAKGIRDQLAWIKPQNALWAASNFPDWHDDARRMGRAAAEGFVRWSGDVRVVRVTEGDIEKALFGALALVKDNHPQAERRE